MENPKITHLLLLQIGILVALFLVILSSHASAMELSEESTNIMGNKTLGGVGDDEKTLLGGTWKWWHHHLSFWKWWHAHKWLHHHGGLGKSVDGTGVAGAGGVIGGGQPGDSGGTGGSGTSNGGNPGYDGGAAEKETRTQLKS